VTDDSTHESAPVPARDAATIMLVRDAAGPEGPVLEVCMLRRHLDSDFVGGAYVFPGGKVDDDDRSTAAGHACAGRDDPEASDLLGIASGGLAFWVAALRECFEEAGVLLAYRQEVAPGGVLIEMADPEARRRLAARRAELNAGAIAFLELLRSEGLQLAVDRVHYFSHWITPEPAPKRYDTRFFVAALPPGQVPVHDDHETVDTVWVRPADALARAAAGEFDLIFPTMKNLEAVSRFATSDELLAAAAAVERVPTVLPRVVADQRGFRILLPGDPGYEEAVGLAAGGAEEMSAAEVGAIVRSVGADGRSERRS
jgi:8-oxo-dGTP pyrophosphatase MutT (NUDIX family)